MDKNIFQSIKRWAGDKIIEHWPMLLTVVAGGGGMTYLAKASEFLGPYGPVVWGAIGVITIFVFSLAYFIYAKAKSKIALSNYANMRREDYSVNVLAPTHTNERINLAHFYHPFFEGTKNIRFENCELFGPAYIYLVNCTITGGKMLDSEIVIMRSDRGVKGATKFENCTFINCILYRITWTMNIEMYNGMPEQVRTSLPVVSDGRIGDI